MALVAQAALTRYSHLLDDGESALLSSLARIDGDGGAEESRALLLRLFSRKGPWFSVDTLRGRYVEVGNVHAAAAALEASGLVERLSAKDLTEDECLRIATPDDLRAASSGAACARPPSRSASRRKLWTNLIAAVGREAAMSRLVACLGDCVRLSDAARATLDLARFLFFLSEEHGFEQFVIRPLAPGAPAPPGGWAWNLPPRDGDAKERPLQRQAGKSGGGGAEVVELPPAQGLVTATRPVFATRRQLARYREAAAASREAEAAREGPPSAAASARIATLARWAAERLAERDPDDCALPSGRQDASLGLRRDAPPCLGRFTGAWVLVGLAHRGLAVLERAKKYAEAVDLARMLLGRGEHPKRRGQWWLRLSLDLEHAGLVESALEVAEAALADELVTMASGDRLAIQKRVLRLGRPPRRWRVPSWAQQAQWRPRERRVEASSLISRRMIGRKSAFVSDYESEEEGGVERMALAFYAGEEGGGWRGMHGEGAPFRSILRAALGGAGVLSAPVAEVWQHPLQPLPLDWGTDTFYAAREALIEAALKSPRAALDAADALDAPYADVAKAIPEHALGAILRNLCKGWGTAGMPDLFLFRPRTGDGSGVWECRFVEVKSKGDTLSPLQLVWLWELSALGLDVEVLKVVEPSRR